MKIKQKSRKGPINLEKGTREKSNISQQNKLWSERKEKEM